MTDDKLKSIVIERLEGLRAALLHEQVKVTAVAVLTGFEAFELPRFQPMDAAASHFFLSVR